MIYNTISDLQLALRNNETTAVAVVKEYLTQIAATAHLNIFVQIYTDEVLAAAELLDERRRDAPETLGALYGAVVALKDVICYEGHTVTGGSAILDGFVSPYSATVVERLVAADALIIGRVNCDEFGMGSTNENSCYGVTRNPHDPTRVPGGSSGGSAAAVAAGCCLFALGSDTGGSVRQPAAWCGVYGYKPTYGRISRHGLLGYASSFDTIGVLANNILDIQAILPIIEGIDGKDSTCIGAKPPIDEIENKSQNQKHSIAYYNNILDNENIDAEVRASMRATIARYREQGATVTAIDFELLDYLVPTYYILTTAEASANLARYDGIRYGKKINTQKNILDTYTMSRNNGFGAEVKRRIMLGTFVLSSGFYDAYYTRAQKVRRLIQEKTNAILMDFDFIICPVTATKPFIINEKQSNPTAIYLSDIFTVQANLCGIPAVAFPAGVHAADGLPIGLQLLAQSHNETNIFSFIYHINHT